MLLGPNSAQEIHVVWLTAVQKRKEKEKQITQPFKLTTKLPFSPARLVQRVKPL